MGPAENARRGRGRGGASGGRGLPQVRPGAPVSLKRIPPWGKLSVSRVRGRGPGVPSLEPVAPDVRAAARMRRLNLAWLLGGVFLLASSVSCNRTFQGEDLAPGGLRRRRNALSSWWKRARRALLRAPLDSLSGFDRSP